MQLDLCHLSKNYGKTCALKDVQLQLQSGVYGLLGPNGAGKSTMIKILTCNLAPTQGNVLWDGKPLDKNFSLYSRQLGYVPQNQGLYENFTARQFLWYMASLKALPRRQIKEQISSLLKQIGLDHVADRKLGSFSGGMRQRILIAQALLGDPKVIILDEPTAGLDPVERIHIRNFVSTLAAHCVVLFATHVVSDIEGIARKIILLNHGEVLFFDSPSALCATMEGHVFLLETALSDLEEIRQHYYIGSILENGGQALLRLIPHQLDAPIETRFSQLLKPAIPTLEDVYLAYIGESGRTEFTEGSVTSNVSL